MNGKTGPESSRIAPPVLDRISILAGTNRPDLRSCLSGWNAARGVIPGGWISIFIFLPVLSGSAQEALQNMQAGSTAADARSQQMQSSQSQDYTFKKGDFRLMVMPSLGLQFNDNINLAQTNVMDDFIVTPAVGITASYPWSERNLLYLDITVGYDWYLMHPQFSSFELNSSSGTGLSFDFGIKDVTINLHDWINYTQGAGQTGSGASGANINGSGTASAYTANSVNGSVANTATYGTFQNTAGLSGSWDLNQVKLSLGYDHQNIIATSGQFDDISHSSEMVFFRPGLQLNPKVTVGLEATAAFTTYEQNVLNDNDAYTLGPYLELRPDQALSISIKGGYTINKFQNTSSTIQTASQNSWYADLNIAHQPTEAVSYSIDAGREVQLGVVSDLLEDWYVRPNITWKVVKGLDIFTFLFFEHGDQGVGSTGSVPGNSNGTFDWYGGGFSLQHALTSWLALSLNYRLTLRSSGAPNDSYTQNLIALELTYHTK
jgi:hypothetical protein